MKKIKDEKGMITVEVVIGLTVYMAFFVLLLNFLNIIYLRQKFQAALKPLALEISRDYECNKYFNSLGDPYAADQVAVLQEDHYEYFRSYAYTPCDDLIENCKYNFCLNIMENYGDYFSAEYLEDMGVVDGYRGIDFSGSGVDETTGELDLMISYEIQIIRLPFFEDAGISMNVEQHASTLLWRY